MHAHEHGDHLVSGFSGSLASRREIEPQRGRVLRMPQDGCVDGPFLRLPEGPFDGAIVEGLSMAMGSLPGFVQQLATRMLPGGELLLDVGNAQGASAVRLALEGRPGACDPAGQPFDPERTALLRDLVEALEAVGLLIRDVYRVAAPDAHPALPGSAPARFWVRARRVAARPGTVLLADDGSERARHTGEALAAFLPGCWEVLHCAWDGEAATAVSAFDAGLARAHGELVWLLPAGALPDAELFERLLQAQPFGAAVPAGSVDSLASPAGLMARRGDVLIAGPMASSAAGWAELERRLGRGGCRTRRVPGVLGGVLPRHEPAAVRDEDPARDAPAVAAAEPRLSLCMVLTDETAAALSECLRSVCGAVDEIVIVDSGASDGVAEAAAAFEARVLPRPWDDDFAAARNAGLEAATGDWVLVLDAGERLAGDGVARLPAALADAVAGGYRVAVGGVHELRLFRRLPGVRFAHRTGEHVRASLALACRRHGLELRTSDLEVERVAPPPSGEPQRTARLLGLELAERPADPYVLYRHAELLRAQGGSSDHAVAALERAFDVLARQTGAELAARPYAGEAAAALAEELIGRGQTRRAAEVVQHALRCFVPTPGLHRIAGEVALRARRAHQALWHFRRCLGQDGQVFSVPVSAGTTSWIALTGMAQARLQQGHLEQAQRLLEQARALCPRYERAALVEARLHGERGCHTESLRVLTEYLAQQPDAPAVCREATAVLVRLGLTDQAREMGDRAAELLAAEGHDAAVDDVRDLVESLV